MLGFWIIAAGTAVITIAILGRALLTGAGSNGTDSTAAYDVQVYRDQLSELDRDVARGVIGEAEAERARIETSRRLLDADRRAQAATGPASAPQGLTLAVLAFAALLIGAGGLGLYYVAGAPGTTDLPLATRIAVAEEARAARATQAEIEAGLPAWAGPPPDVPADYLDMVDKLRAAVEGRADDLQGQELLAQHEGALGNYRAAHAAMARVIALKGDAADAVDYTTYADLMVLAAQGLVSPEAEAAVRQALEIDPENGIALYYLGLMYGQNDRPDRGFPIWRDLLERARPGDPWAQPIRSQIGQLAAMAGVDYTPPTTAASAAPIAGPTADDIEAAADMTDEERGEMIRGMVTRLMDRLATEGGTPQEWAQLIGALAILGQTDQARGIWGEAQSVFAEVPQALAMIDETARNAGLDDPVTFAPDTSSDAPADTPADTSADPETTLSGPTADDIAAAAELSDEDRAEMIDGMVTRLSDELATIGGPPEKWVMLLRSLGQLGEIDRARAVWGEAQKYFADDAAGLAAVRPAAEALGVAN